MNNSKILAKRVCRRKGKQSGEEGSNIDSPSKISRKKKAAMESSDSNGNITKMLKETQHDLLKDIQAAEKISNFCKNMTIEDTTNAST